MVRRAHPLAAAVLGGLCLLPLLWPQGAVQGATGIAPLPAHQPRRVVSINLCTDQLAMMMAGPGQLVSVSHLAGDPTYSTMPEAAAAYPANRGLAEEVYLLKPDLVLAGAAILQAVQELWPCTRVRVADRGLREGILMSLMSGAGKRKRRRRRRRGRGSGTGSTVNASE